MTWVRRQGKTGVLQALAVSQIPWYGTWYGDDESDHHTG